MNGTKLLLSLILAGATLVMNAGFWILNRMEGIDAARARLEVIVEQRCGRIEAKLDRLLERRGLSPGAVGPPRRAGRDR